MICNMSGVYFHCLSLFNQSAMNETSFVFWKIVPSWREVERRGTCLVKAFISIKCVEKPNQKQPDKL